MKKLLLISNGTVEGKGYLEHAGLWIAQHFSALRTAPKTVLFIPWATKDGHELTKKAALALGKYGINTVPEDGLDRTQSLLNRIDGIMVGGGNTFRLLGRLRASGLFPIVQKLVEEGMPYVGISAGCNIAGPTIRTTNDMPIVELDSLHAMNFVPFQINAHYVEGAFYYMRTNKMVRYNGETRDVRITEFHEENDAPVLGIREGTAIQIENSSVRILGGQTARFFVKGQMPVEITDGDELTKLIM